ncbi:tetraacyldisaccharide 4'-kinase [Mucilaginibacter sp. HMF5004]|uniref:tetraacyldisaccharide 4'-kinase n=1 Tax=Mucilaginibacter rivuli TaxID=2857527 RepID=UPI001C601013|nr:tetraacyldisaccharide 4'-kinase [Mucilaginibacter rivuli]MBW4888849.1 tetraacyldisaccharide 4'-kinase [Mucilaginibacter rivuli]
MIKYLRLLLLPFSWLYGLAIMIRNWCYDKGIFPSRSFDMPIISVGNLDVGGAGKSPMTEYLINLFKNGRKLATLSRGYGRITKGYLEAETDSTDVEVGDEPAQFKQKFPDITVAVCEKRVDGIKRLRHEHNLIILDDAFQHRALEPGLSILLFDFSRVYQPRFLLPAGNLREPFSGYKRADIIVVTKCPPALNEQHQQQIQKRIAPLKYQQLFFTKIAYAALQDIAGNTVGHEITKDAEVFLLTGIANPVPLLKHLQNGAKAVIHHNYPDHHRFTLKNIAKLADEFDACTAQKKLIITTEKDAQRLREQVLLPTVEKLNILVLPIAVKFLDRQQQFDEIVKDYVRKY